MFIYGFANLRDARVSFLQQPNLKETAARKQKSPLESGPSLNDDSLCWRREESQHGRIQDPAQAFLRTVLNVAAVAALRLQTSRSFSVKRDSHGTRARRVISLKLPCPARPCPSSVKSSKPCE